MHHNVNQEEVVLSLHEHWVPTKESGNKIVRIQFENMMNVPYEQLNDRTIFEDSIIHGNADNCFKMSPLLKKSPLSKILIQMLPLQPKAFRYNSVFSMTGGVLNLFNPKINESQNEELHALLQKYPDKQEAIRAWRETPQDCWGELTPNLVWAGGGEQENKLLQDFLDKLTDKMESVPFLSEGECLLESIKFLRTWQFINNSVCGNMKPHFAILEERAQIFQQKIKLLKEMNIENDFSE